MAGFCNQCHKPIQANDFKMQKGRKICGDCIRQVEKQKQDLKANDKDKEGLFSFLISSFNISKVPESWYASVDGMLKKGFSCKGIQFTIKYCVEKGKYITEDNWPGLVYIYYIEAKEEMSRLSQLQKRNEEFNLEQKVTVVNISSTNYRDKPNFNIEDL